MNALVFDPADGSFKLVKNHPIPSVEKPGDVLVRVKRAGLCGTDLHIIKVLFFFYLFQYLLHLFN